MTEINAIDVINSNDYTLMLVKDENKDTHILMNGNGEKFILKTGKGVSIKNSRKLLARHIANITHFTAAEAEKFIEIEGCDELNKRYNLPYKYKYLYSDKWLVVKVDK